MKIRGYTLIGELKNDNSGYAKWGFAKKDGQEVFIKQFLTPIYPLDASVISEKQFQQKIDICKTFERDKRDFYYKLNHTITGNVVIVTEFFREGSKYYIITEKIDVKMKEPSEIAIMSLEQKLIIAKVILHCIDKLHKNGIVHNDLKPDNILLKETQSGMLTPKIIDFDSGFLRGMPPQIGEDLQGDPIYLAPESFLFLAEKVNVLTRKVDIFALGIILHQYFCGELPSFDRKRYNYLFEFVLDDNIPIISVTMPSYIRELLAKMLDKHPARRPTASEAFAVLTKKGEEVPETKVGTFRSVSDDDL